jgi:hypothetical protein
MMLMTLIMILIEPKSGADQDHVIPIAGGSISRGAILPWIGTRIGVTRRIDARIWNR